MDPKLFARAIVSIERKYGLRLDVQEAWLRLDESCDTSAGWQGTKGQCKRISKKWKEGMISTGGFGGLEPGQQHDAKAHQEKSNRVSKLVDVLERGRFKNVPSDDKRVRHGKSGALTALRDAKNPRVGLIAAKNKDGQPVGFMSYKPGRSTIEIQTLGTDQSEKGIGRALFKDLLSVAAKLGKGITVAPTNDAIGFYEKMGMTKESEGALSLTAKQVQAMAKSK